MERDNFNIVISTGHLGTAPSKSESFRAAMETGPDVVVADAGSSDPGPVYLGEDIGFGLFVREELELFLKASRKRKIPFVLGSAGDAGTNLGVDSFVEIIKELAIEHNIPKFKVGYFYSEVPRDFIKKKIEAGDKIEGLDGFPSLTSDDVEQATRIVAVAGVHPFIKLLDMGADVIIGGRSGDIAIIAAPAIHAGFPESLAYHTGKMIECASFCAEPFMGKEAVIGTISHEDIKIKAYHPEQRCTVASVCGHSMYERATPFYEYAAGGMLDMSECQYTQFDEKTAKITGARWIPSDTIRIKLEGAKRVGERYLGIAAVRDPHVIKHIDEVVQWCRDSVERLFGCNGYKLYFHIFGKNGVLKEMEPVKETKSHELCVVIEGVSEEDELAKKVTDYAGRMMFLARIPGIKGTAGAAATTKMAMKTTPGFIWNVNHTIPINDPMELFAVNITEAGI